MAKINLLPWRIERRQQRKREFMGTLAVVAVVGVLLVVAAMQFFDAQIQAQADRNAYLDSEIKILDQQIADIKDLEAQRDRLLQRQKIIENLQANRSTTVHLLDELVNAIPDGVYLTNLKQTGNALELQGRAQSHARISQFMEKLDDSPWLKSSDLQIILRGEAPAANVPRSMTLASIRQNFTLRIDITNPNTPADQLEESATVQGGK